MELQSSSNGIPAGQMKTQDNWSMASMVSFSIQQALSRLQTSMPVKIMAVVNAGEVSPVGLVDILPLVNQIDNQGNSVEHTTIYNVPYFRTQGGANAVIIDPQVGDIGIACFASRDISKIKKTKKQGNPGSLRQFSFSDALYIGGILNGTPTQYVQFNSTGIKIHSPNLVNLDSPDVQINCQTLEVNATTSMNIATPALTLSGQTVDITASTSMTVTTPIFQINGQTVLNGSLTQGAGSNGGTAAITGPMTVTNDVTAGGKSAMHHTHSGVQTGSSQTGQPT